MALALRYNGTFWVIGRVTPGSKMSRDHEKQVVPCVLPSEKDRKLEKNQPQGNRTWHPGVNWPYSQKNGGKKPKNVAGETGAGRRHGAIHFISRKRKPTAFYILKTRNLYQITPWNGASCSNLLNSNIGIFFPISPQGKIVYPKPKTSTYLLTTLTANTEVPIWIDSWASNLTFTPPKHRIK